MFFAALSLVDTINARAASIFLQTVVEAGLHISVYVLITYCSSTHIAITVLLRISVLA